MLAQSAVEANRTRQNSPRDFELETLGFKSQCGEKEEETLVKI